MFLKITETIVDVFIPVLYAYFFKWMSIIMVNSYVNEHLNVKYLLKVLDFKNNVINPYIQILSLN